MSFLVQSSLCRFGVCLTTIVLWSALCHGQQQPDAAGTITRWLLTIDTVGEEGALESQLASLGADAEAGLIDAAVNGPSASTLTDFNNLSGQEFDFLSTADTSEMTFAEIQAITGFTRNQFVAMETEKHVLHFRSRAVAGLGVIATPPAIQVIQSFAEDDSSPLQDIAKLTLRGLQSPQDTIPPTTSAKASPSPNLAGWNNTNVTVTLNSTDNEPGGSGVKQIAYSAAGAQTFGSTIVSGGLASFTISTEGFTTVAFFGTDNAGNIETVKTIMIQLDKTPPTINGSRIPPPNVNGWNNTNVTASFQCTDTLSGLAAGSPPSPTTFSSEGAGQSVTGTCTDVAGNSASATVNGINIDKTPPAVTASPNPTALWPPNGKLVNVTVSGTMSDNLSGVNPNSAIFAVVDSYGFVQPTGHIAVNANGTYSFTVALEARRDGQDKAGRLYTITVSGQDKAANQSSASTTVIVPHDQGN